MKFTYKAPEEYLDTSGKKLKTVESEYNGPHDIKILVDKQTRKFFNVEFDHDGHPEIHGGTDSSNDVWDHMYLHSHNPNHIVLMAMICNHEDHETDDIAEVIDTKYNMVYVRPEHPNLLHTYEMSEITISTDGIVTYPWKQPHITWSEFSQGVSYQKTYFKNLLLSNAGDNIRIEKINRCIEIMDYITTNMRNVSPWKIAFPNLNTITMDNSVAIGSRESHELPVKIVDYTFTTTDCWGVVDHEPAFHIEGDDFVLDAICPTNQVEASQLQPWNELTDQHPTHSVAVSAYNAVQQSLIDSNPDIALTTSMIQAAYRQQLAQQAALAAPATPAVDPNAAPATPAQ
jgi:hypothetical protein